MAATFEIYKDSAGAFRWRLKSANHQNIASSGESFTTKASAQNGIDAVKRDAPGAEVVDLTKT